MGSRVKDGQKRTYDGSRRRALARHNQAHIAECARELFLEEGYAGTSIRDIASRAGVAVQTIYNAFDGKPAVLSRVFDIALAGDDEPVALAEREDLHAIQTATDPQDVIQRWVRYATGTFVRLLPILHVLREAANTDPTIDALFRRAIANRYASTRDVAAKLSSLGVLPDELDTDRAADIMWAYISYDTAEPLIVERGWTPRSYADWSAHLLCTLFGIERAAPGQDGIRSTSV